ncbi:uncharacterized protein LOC144367024 [Ictidomys tridecemlineatus]
MSFLNPMCTSLLTHLNSSLPHFKYSRSTSDSRRPYTQPFIEFWSEDLGNGSGKRSRENSCVHKRFLASSSGDSGVTRLSGIREKNRRERLSTRLTLQAARALFLGVAPRPSKGQDLGPRLDLQARLPRVSLSASRHPGQAGHGSGREGRGGRTRGSGDRRWGAVPQRRPPTARRYCSAWPSPFPRGQVHRLSGFLFSSSSTSPSSHSRASYLT